MLRTGLVIIPNDQGTYEKSLHFAQEYNKIANGIFRSKNQVSCYTITGENISNPGSSVFRIPKNSKIPNITAFNTEALSKFLLDRKGFATFYCARVILIFPDLFHLPPITNEIPEKQIIELANSLVSRKDDFDSLYIDVIALKSGTNFHKEIGNITIHVIDGDLNDVKDIACFHMGISQVTLGKISILFKQPQKVEDIVEFESPNPFQYFSRTEVNPLVLESYNCIFYYTDEKPLNVEKELENQVIIIDQKYMITLSSTTGLRFSRIGALPNIDRTFYFKAPPEHPILLSSLPSSIIISQNQPGFRVTRTINAPVTSLLEIESDEIGNLIIQLIHSLPKISSMANMILSPVFSPNPENKSVQTSLNLIDNLVDMARKRDLSIFPSDEMKQRVNELYKLIFKGLFMFTSKFKDCTAQHEAISSKVSDSMKKLNYEK
ncbi:hypothetical protein TVAG_192410 [Trichomonas vaginalis G3]|uniref:Uncharacterized protein n=1 Tax=Trichomonas vaginalis (strain ATCC PRA-98 / G3) TaxID=412133 RepID=A2DGV5_TRIV3|nr:hypothetical protein TVAGG3_0318850 [Trichomonas vaginalis G3]EAY20265.1 hypothetical protein TVAG_192410 [Trichomonas vaginalis G3]KAI5529137.1 hypothetical protein TVAGG3_0318850 [Trichomonas vaginalis G3]|eukprot:XP_001581251.1 hypothetical protein [Trichomonas vaginalis G3]